MAPQGSDRRAAGDKLWEPSPETSSSARLTDFTSWVNARYALELTSYQALWEWSVEDVAIFWQAVWDYFQLGDRYPAEDVLTARVMPGASWFPRARVNFAKYLLDRGADDAVAVFHEHESDKGRQLTWRELRDSVRRLAAVLTASGVKAGDRVAGYLCASPEAVIAFLATAAIGAVWTCCASELGQSAVAERLKQVQPKLLIAADSYAFNGRIYDRRSECLGIVEAVRDIETLIIIGRLGQDAGAATSCRVIDWHDALAHAPRHDVQMPLLPFDHPLWVVYTSGTTGPPKPLVHGHGGVLVELLKHHALHLNLNERSRVFFFTTTGWIVFPVLVGALLTGSAIVTYEGSPFFPDAGRLWQVVESRRLTHFGTSPAFVESLKRLGYVPAENHDLSSLQCLLCTGSPLLPDSFAWIYESVKRDLWVASVSGGTDVVSSLVGPVPTLPVFNGEIQARCLGADVRAMAADGECVVGVEGELVIAQPIPTMPLYILNDPAGGLYQQSYFDSFPGLWSHGDLLKLTERGTCIISGRSDATLNRNGVRIGPSEVYQIVESIHGIEDSLVIDVDTGCGTSQIHLFVVAASAVADSDIESMIARALREQGSPRHVPDVIRRVASIPRTLTGKKLEIPVKRLFAGVPADQTVDPNVVANPEALAEFATLAAAVRSQQR